jgi:hypothetical protein
VLREDVRVDVRQLDRIAQDADLVAEAADVVVGDVRDLLEHHLFDGGLRHLLERVVRARVVEDVIADLQGLAPQRIRQRDHALVVGVAERDHAVVGQEVHHRRDLTARDEARGLDDVERLVQHDLLAFHELERVDVRVDVHAHLAAVDEDLGGAVLVGAREDSVVVRRSAELVDLFLEELDLLLGFLEHTDQTLVLALGVGELLAGEVVSAAHRLVLGEHAVEAAAEFGRVGAEQSQRVAEIFDFVARRARGIAITRIRGIAIRSRRSGGDASHHVAHEALSTRPRIELAAHAVSSFSR